MTNSEHLDYLLGRRSQLIAMRESVYGDVLGSKIYVQRDADMQSLERAIARVAARRAAYVKAHPIRGFFLEHFSPLDNSWAAERCFFLSMWANTQESGLRKLNKQIREIEEEVIHIGELARIDAIVEGKVKILPDPVL